MKTHNFVAVVWNEANEAWEVLTSMQAISRLEATSKLYEYMKGSAHWYAASDTPNTVWLFPLDGSNAFSLDIRTTTTLELI